MANFLYNPAISQMNDDLLDLPTVLISDCYTEPFGYHTMRPSGLQNWLITYTLAGQGIFRIQNTVIECSAGDIVILPPTTSHDYMTASGHVWKFHWAHFTPAFELFTKIALPEPRNGIYVSRIHSDDRRRRIDLAFQSLHRDLMEESDYREALGHNSLELILVLFSQESSIRQVDPRVDKVLKYLIDNLHRQIRIEELAELVSLSPSRLSHLFKSVVGRSIVESLLHMRLRHSANLLQFTTDSVGHISTSVGFSSPYYFSQKFHSFFGMSPTTYRTRFADECAPNER